MFSKLKKQAKGNLTDYRSLAQKPSDRNGRKPTPPKRPNHMAYRAVSRPPAPGGGR